VYREHERLLNEHRAQQELLRQQTKNVRDSQHTNDVLSEQLRQSLTEQAVLRERVKPYLLQHRENRRQLREQTRQIETLRTLLSQLAPPA
jgi:hypothetical protein